MNAHFLPSAKYQIQSPASAYKFLGWFLSFFLVIINRSIVPSCFSMPTQFLFVCLQLRLHSFIQMQYAYACVSMTSGPKVRPHLKYNHNSNIYKLLK